MFELCHDPYRFIVRGCWHKGDTSIAVIRVDDEVITFLGQGFVWEVKAWDEIGVCEVKSVISGSGFIEGIKADTNEKA